MSSAAIRELFCSFSYFLTIICFARGDIILKEEGSNDWDENNN